MGSKVNCRKGTRETHLISFLIYTDSDGTIDEIRLSEPPYLLSRLNMPLSGIFNVVEKDRLKEFFSSTRGTNIDDLPLFTLKDQELPIRLHFSPAGKRKIVFGIDDDSFLQIRESTAMKRLLRDLVSAFYISSGEIQMLDKETVQMNFEQIQMLNNRLVNTERILQRERSKLQVVNKELNNRLVKDALTGLVSRYQYRAEIEHTIASAPKEKGIFVFIDIDDFKKVNDTHGHQIGDMYLIEFADRLQGIPLEGSVKMRISGDEFGLFAHRITGDVTDEMARIWDLIKSHILFGPIKAEDSDIPLSVSAGMACYGEDTTDIYDLIEYADFAMYKAKRSGKNRYAVFGLEEYEKTKEEKNQALGRI